MCNFIPLVKKNSNDINQDVRSLTENLAGDVAWKH